ncbi:MULTISPECIES: 3'-5' exoribonuclease domain-containing protein [Streptomyces]|uniref:3'-5' exoribonuclease domain-containing protein n=1 Tax=Streptomyces flavovirens TaxID=52258 RepID=A0ABV8NEK5_9ACTN|nr:3'-5' exoribonuclease [Streptomyces sp. MBT51]MBK3596263.1 3'-5' exoribonuclease [Streptomyces sp. MBT51]
MTTRIFIDTEFLDDGARIDLISIGMVTEDGRELYAVSSEFDQAAVRRHGWLMANVWPSLPIAKNPRGKRGMDRLDVTHPDVRPRAQIARLVHDFILSAPDPQLWAYYSAYDHVALAQLFGPMSDLPAGIPMQTCDLVQEAQRLGLTPDELPQQADGHHNALADARHNLVMARHLDTIAR